MGKAKHLSRRNLKMRFRQVGKTVWVNLGPGLRGFHYLLATSRPSQVTASRNSVKSRSLSIPSPALVHRLSFGRILVRPRLLQLSLFLPLQVLMEQRNLGIILTSPPPVQAISGQRLFLKPHQLLPQLSGRHVLERPLINRDPRSHYLCS